jgi:hypothetical protein
MSKEELSKWYGKASPAYYDQEDLENAMVAAYNKAISDAMSLKEDMYPHNGTYWAVDVDRLEQLKIRD